MPTIDHDEPLDRHPRHGYVDQPRSRAYWCSQTPGSNCGSISSEPQSVEAPKGFPAARSPAQLPTPRDGELASANHRKFSTLDGALTPNGKPWPATKVRPNSIIRVRWWLTAAHKTERWQYWITRDGWDESAPLTRAQLEPEPFSNFEWPCPSGGWTCHMPQRDVHHFMYLPDKRGRHVVYAIWVVGDTDNAFHQAIDLDFGSGAGYSDDEVAADDEAEEDDQ